MGSFVPAMIHAQSGTATNPGTGGSGANPSGTANQVSIPNPIGVTSLGAFFQKIADFAVQIAYVAIACFLLLAGFRFITARGNEDALSKAKNTFFFTIIGALIIIGAQVVIDVIQSIVTGLGK